MEEENVASTLPDLPQQPQPDSWTSIDHRYLNGEQQAIVWDETEVQMSRSQDSDQLEVSVQPGRDSPEDVEQWEQVMWPMTCASPPLSFATVQWDAPDPTPELDQLETDGGVATELDSDTTPLSPHQSEDVFAPEIREEEGGFDVKPPNPGLETAGSSPEPCDAADVREPTTQEKEESTQVLLDGNNEIPCSSEEEGEEDSEVEAVDLNDILEEAESSEDGADSFVDLKLEEEQEEQSRVLPSGRGDSEEEQAPAQGADAQGEEEESEEEVEEEQEEQPQVLAGGQGDSVEEQAPTQGVETEEEEKEEEEEEEELGEDQEVKKDPCAEESEEAETFSCPSDAEAPAEALHTDSTGPTTEEPDQPIDPPPSDEDDIEIVERFDEDPSGQTQEPEMCEDVDRNVDPDQTEAALHTDPADDAEKNSQEIEEQSENLEETRGEQTASEEPEPCQSEQLEAAEEPEQIQEEEEEHLEPTMESTEESTQPEATEGLSEEVCVDSEEQKQREQTEPPEQNEQTNKLEEAPDESGATERPSGQTEAAPRAEPEVIANGGQRAPGPGGGEEVERMARELAQRLFRLDGIQRVDVVKHLDKDHDFSRAVGEEYLKFFDFTGQTLDHALRSFLKVVVLIGETQERERVLQHFASRFHQCNPASFSSSGSVLALTCALMLLNTDLHGQNVGKSMSSSKFVSNLDGMNEGENFNKDLLKSLYNSIKSEPLEWAVDEEELKNKVLVDEDAADDAPLRSKANPFQDVPHDKTASVVKEGFLQRKLHADMDGKRTPWGKRGWKTFYGVLKGMVLYLQKDDIRREQPTNEEVVSVHHSLAEQAADYTKKPHVFRLQTADWRVFLFQASSRVEMNSWISRINLVSALHSSPPFPAAVGSQRRFFRPILPASQSAHTLERQLQSHAGMLESFKADLSYLQEKPPESKKAKAKELEEQRVRAEYLHYEMCRYETYIQVLEAWKKTGDAAFGAASLSQFDRAVCADSLGEEEEEEGLKKSISSPSLEMESPRPSVVKVRRNISERRTYRRAIIPRRNKEA